MTSTLAVIAARYGSLRIPGKPLADIGGISMLRRVWNQVAKVGNLSECVIATENSRVIEHARTFNAQAILTRDTHRSGYERAGEVLSKLTKEGKCFDNVLVIPCDRPFIKAHLMEGVMRVLDESDASVEAATAVAPITGEEDFGRHATVKAVLGVAGQVLYFSRAPVPHTRNREDIRRQFENVFGHKHIDVYAFKFSLFQRLDSLVPGMLERREDLEQLRLISNGVVMRAFIAQREFAEPDLAVNTPDDMRRAVTYAKTHVSTSTPIPGW